MFKTITKKILCGVLALTASFGALATMTGCETSYPEVEIQLEFNGKAYTLEYKLYRKLAPATVNHFLALADAHYYDGLVIHDYKAGKMYGGGYTWSDGELTYKEYYTEVAKIASFPTTVYRDEAKTLPTYTLYGEFGANNFSVQSGVLKESYGSLAMFYTDKNTDAEVVVERSSGAGAAFKEYKYNSATSLFSICLSDASASSKEYCTFGTLQNKDTLKNLRKAIEDFVESKYGDAEEYMDDFVTSTVIQVDEDDAIVGNQERTALYTVPNEPIVIKKVSVTKY